MDELLTRPHATEPLSLTTDQKERVKIITNKILSHLPHLVDFLDPKDEDAAISARDTVDNIIGIIEYELSDLSKVVGYEGRLSQEMESRSAGIRQANAKARELEQLLAEGKDITGTGVLIGRIDKAIKGWWSSHGFTSPYKFEHAEYGLKTFLRPNIALRDMLECSTDPVTRKKRKEMMIALHESKGLSFVESKWGGDGSKDVKDTPDARRYLFGIINEDLPGVTISSVKSRPHTGDVCSIDEIEIFVRYIKLGDIEKYAKQSEYT